MYYFSLRINALEDKVDDINRILGINSNYPEVGWGIEIQYNNEVYDSEFIDYFLSILDNKYDDLSNIGIHIDDISLWMLYEYDQQCNIEISPQHMLKMGERGISFCISCWQK